MDHTQFARDINERLTQSTFWTDANGAKHRVRHLPQGYSLNIILWLEDRADQLQATAILDAHLKGTDDGRRIAADGPRAWLHASPLVKKLFAQLDAEHRLALVRGEAECQRCHHYIIGGGSTKFNGLPMHAACAGLAKHDAERQAEHNAKSALSEQINQGLEDCHAEIRPNVPGMMDFIRDPNKLREIVLSLEKTPTSDIMVLGVFLANAAETALAQHALSDSATARA